MFVVLWKSARLKVELRSLPNDPEVNAPSCKASCAPVMPTPVNVAMPAEAATDVVPVEPTFERPLTPTKICAVDEADVPLVTTFPKLSTRATLIAGEKVP